MSKAKASRTFTFTGRLDYARFYIALIEALSPLKRMSMRESEVAAAFVAVSDNLAPRFSTPYRKRVREELNLSESQLSNILKSLRESGVLKEDSVGELFMHPSYVPPPNGAEITLNMETRWEQASGIKQS